MIPTKIIVHHSLTKDSGTVSWGDIRRYHITPPPDGMGMLDIGYHAGVELVESGGHSLNFEVLMGRMWDEEGAHTKGQNNSSLGICFIGNYDLIEPPEEMLEAGAKVVALWVALYNISCELIYGHHFFASYKTCPGLKFPLERFITMVRTAA